MTKLSETILNIVGENELTINEAKTQFQNALKNEGSTKSDRYLAAQFTKTLRYLLKKNKLLSDGDIIRKGTGTDTSTFRPLAGRSKRTTHLVLLSLCHLERGSVRDITNWIENSQELRWQREGQTSLMTDVSSILLRKYEAGYLDRERSAGRYVYCMNETGRLMFDPVVANVAQVDIDMGEYQHDMTQPM